MTDLSAQELLERSYREPIEQRRETLRQAVAAADVEEDLEQGHSIRMAYISACHNAPDCLEMIAAFGWCVARHDEDPDRFPLQLWYYKWVINAARGFAGVSRDQLQDLVEDMNTRYVAANAAAGPVRKARLFNAKWLGDVAELQGLFDEWRNTNRSSRSGMNDCSACDVATEAEMLQTLGQHEEALTVARPLINRDTGCSTEPHYTFALMLESCRSIGTDEQLELADRLSLEGLDMISGNTDFVEANGDHLRHFAATGKGEQALALLRATAPYAGGSDDTLFAYARGARMALRLAQVSGATELTELTEQFDGVAEDIAARFDDRNGNSFLSGLLRFDDQELAPHL